MTEKELAIKNYYVNRVISRLAEYKDELGISYESYIVTIKKCNDLEVIKELAEIDLQIEYLQYISKINSKLRDYNTSMDDIRSINMNMSAASIKDREISCKNMFGNLCDITDEFVEEASNTGVSAALPEYIDEDDVNDKTYHIVCQHRIDKELDEFESTGRLLGDAEDCLQVAVVGRLDTMYSDDMELDLEDSEDSGENSGLDTNIDIESIDDYELLVDTDDIAGQEMGSRFEHLNSMNMAEENNTIKNTKGSYNDSEIDEGCPDDLSVYDDSEDTDKADNANEIDEGCPDDLSIYDDSEDNDDDSETDSTYEDAEEAFGVVGDEKGVNEFRDELDAELGSIDSSDVNYSTEETDIDSEEYIDSEDIDENNEEELKFDEYGNIIDPDNTDVEFQLDNTENEQHKDSESDDEQLNDFGLVGDDIDAEIDESENEEDSIVYDEFGNIIDPDDTEEIVEDDVDDSDSIVYDEFGNIIDPDDAEEMLEDDTDDSDGVAYDEFGNIIDPDDAEEMLEDDVDTQYVGEDSDIASRLFGEYGIGSPDDDYNEGIDSNDPGVPFDSEDEVDDTPASEIVNSQLEALKNGTYRMSAEEERELQKMGLVDFNDEGTNKTYGVLEKVSTKIADEVTKKVSDFFKIG